MSKDLAPTQAAPPVTPPGTILGIPKRTLVIASVVTIAVWAFAIQTGSVIFMSIIGGLTLLVIGFFVWAIRYVKKQQKLANMLQGAVNSPEARRDALARLAQGKDANDATNVFARAQLLAADDPAQALQTIESLEIAKIPPQLQDDVAILRAQLYLHFGRPKDARPMADRVNVDNPQRKDARPTYAAIVGEAWARTGKAQEALALLGTVDFDAPANEPLKMQLLVARAFAHFAIGKKGAAREDLKAISAIDVNGLGRFLMPQFKVHPELQKLARAVAEKHPQVRAMARSQQRPDPRGGGGRRPR